MGLLPVSSDFDAEFARAADMLESGHRAEAERILNAIRQTASQPGWEARTAFLLAADDQRRRDFALAVKRLRRAPAATIGLEPYRRLWLGRALFRTGNAAGAGETLRAAFETEEPFAMRADAGRDLAVSLEKGGHAAGALRVLSAVSAVASGAEARSLALERIRLGLVAGAASQVRAGAHDLLFAGVDPGGSVPRFARRSLQEEAARLSSADRARLGRLLLASEDPKRGVRLLQQSEPFWPKADRSQNLLALATGLKRLGDLAAADSAASRVPEDGSAASFEARLLRADLLFPRLQAISSAPAPAGDPLAASLRRSLLSLAEPPSPHSVRITARERLVRLAGGAGRFEEGLEHARLLVRENPGTAAGFEPLWKLAWEKYRQGDFGGARRRLDGLSSVYRDPVRERRISYWRARCFQREKRREDALPLFESLAGADPADLYALFARRRVRTFRRRQLVPLADPSTATATYRRTDELLRLRMFEEAAAEARVLPVSRGRDLRLAEAEFALGHFSASAASAKRAFPEIATAEEGRVPDGWRRLFYPIEEKGFLADRAREVGLDAALLRALVRQESVFDPGAKSRAGALGLTQLLPSTAKSLARSVLRVRYRRAFLYDPSVNARLGAAYLRQLLDRFGSSSVFALAAYNGGPTRMTRLLRENAGLEEDELFESHPAYETRDYVRRVLLFAESYRALYP